MPFARESNKQQQTAHIPTKRRMAPLTRRPSITNYRWYKTRFFSDNFVDLLHNWDCGPTFGKPGQPSASVKMNDSYTVHCVVISFTDCAERLPGVALRGSRRHSWRILLGTTQRPPPLRLRRSLCFGSISVRRSEATWLGESIALENQLFSKAIFSSSEQSFSSSLRLRMPLAL